MKKIILYVLGFVALIGLSLWGYQWLVNRDLDKAISTLEAYQQEGIEVLYYCDDAVRKAPFEHETFFRKRMEFHDKVDFYLSHDPFFTENERRKGWAWQGNQNGEGFDEGHIESEAPLLAVPATVNPKCKVDYPNIVIYLDNLRHYIRVLKEERNS